MDSNRNCIQPDSATSKRTKGSVLMQEHNVIAIYETLAKIFELRENCQIKVIVKQKEK